MLETIKNRRSIRKFKEEKIIKKDLESILKVALLAPSGKGKKPVELIVVEDKEIIFKLEKCKDSGTVPLKTAPLVVVVIGDKKLSDTWVEDASIVSILIQLEVEKLGLGSTWIQMRNRKSNGEDSEVSVRKTLQIPEKYGVLSLVAIGHKNEDKKPYDDENADFGKVHYNKF